MIMKEKETVSLLQFQSSKGIGSVRGKQLIEKFGSAWDAICWARSARHSVPPWAEILRQDGPRRRAETEFKEAQDRGYTLFGYGQAGYPRRLTEIPDPPLVLFVEGEASLAASNTLSVVGTRRMTPYGAAFCKALIEDLKAYRPTLVSGFAEGIDITVQMAAVEAGLATVSLLGSRARRNLSGSSYGLSEKGGETRRLGNGVLEGRKTHSFTFCSAQSNHCWFVFSDTGYSIGEYRGEFDHSRLGLRLSPRGLCGSGQNHRSSKQGLFGTHSGSQGTIDF